MSAAELRHLASLGLSADQIAGVAELLTMREAANAKTARAERNRRYYEKRLKPSENVLTASENVLNVLIKRSEEHTSELQSRV
jgi:hypothetical protein